MGVVPGPRVYPGFFVFRGFLGVVSAFFIRLNTASADTTSLSIDAARQCRG